MSQEDDPIFTAFQKYKKTENYAHMLSLLPNSEHYPEGEGLLWAAFERGYNACLGVELIG